LFTLQNIFKKLLDISFKSQKMVGNDRKNDRDFPPSVAVPVVFFEIVIRSSRGRANPVYKIKQLGSIYMREFKLHPTF